MSSCDFEQNASRLKPPIPHNTYLEHLSLSGCIVFQILDMPRLLQPFNACISPTIELDDTHSSCSISPDIFASGSPAVKLPDTNTLSNGHGIYLNISGSQELPIIPLALRKDNALPHPPSLLGKRVSSNSPSYDAFFSSFASTNSSPPTSYESLFSSDLFRSTPLMTYSPAESHTLAASSIESNLVDLCWNRQPEKVNANPRK